MTGKGILRYLAYVFIGGWMFLLGIMVGRETVPVSFDTSGLHERLAAIVEDKSKNADPDVELKFYDALDQPNDPDVLEGNVKSRKVNLLEKQKNAIVLVSDEKIALDDQIHEDQRHDEPGKETESSHGMPLASASLADRASDMTKDSEVLPKKTSRKSETLNRAALNQFMRTSSHDGQPGRQAEEPPKAGPKSLVDSTGPEVFPKVVSNKVAPNREKSFFTIQLASFRAEKDAAAYISQLQKKGVTASVEKTRIDETLWHRVRLGSFSSHGQASERLEKLKENQIDGFIIQTKDGKK